MPETLLFLTELLGLPVYDLKGRRIGRIRDSAVLPLVHNVAMLMPCQLNSHKAAASSAAPWGNARPRASA